MKLTYFHFYTLVSYLIFVSSQTLEFTQHPNAVYYTYTGIPLVIQCNSTGDQIIYRRNNVAVRTTTTNQAHTQNSPMVDVDGSAAGVYWDCQTSDNDGEILSSRAIVYWAKFKDSSTSGQQITVTVLDTVNSYLPCDFFNGSLPTPVIGWELNGNPIVNPSILPGSNSLLLEAFVAVDGDEYRCFIENSYGDPNDRIQANAVYVLSVVGTFSLPSLVFPSTDITSTVGDILHFECVAYAFDCFWQYFIEGGWATIPTDGSPFSSNLQSVTVTTDTPTLYRAILVGVIQDTRTLTVYQVPEVVSSIEGELIEYELQTISIYCQTSGVPVPTIEMYKDGVLLENGAKYTLTTSGNTTTLEIADLTDSDTGYYTCRADNSEASAVANGRITVRVAVPPSFSQHPTPDSIDAINNANDIFSISCSATGDPLPQIQWEFTSSTGIFIITESTKYTIVDSRNVDNSSRTSMLTVSSVTARDNGGYKCLSENFKGAEKSQVSTVKIPSDPVIDSLFPSDVVKILEKEMYLQDCVAYAEPQPVVTWSTAGSMIANTTVFTIFPNNTLAVVGNRQQSGRVYTCTATSAGTQVTNSFTLIVNSCAIVEVTPSGPLNSIDHFNTTITCSSEGEPVPSSEWVYMRKVSMQSGTLPSTLNGVTVVDEYTFSIETISSGNEGLYCCNVYTEGLNETCGIQSECVAVEYVKDCEGLYFCIFELWQLIVIIFIVIAVLMTIAAVLIILCIWKLRRKVETLELPGINQISTELNNAFGYRPGLVDSLAHNPELTESMGVESKEYVALPSYPEYMTVDETSLTTLDTDVHLKERGYENLSNIPRVIIPYEQVTETEQNSYTEMKGVQPYEKYTPMSCKKEDKTLIAKFMPIKDFPASYEQYVASGIGEDSLFWVEFQKLKVETMKNDELESDDASKAENLQKNPIKNILPFDENRVVLDSPHFNCNYINASWLDNSQFIATINPTQETHLDFLQMIFQTEANMVIMLTTRKEKAKILSGISNRICYWPKKDKPINCEPYVLTLINSTETNAFVKQEISLKNTLTGKEHSFTQCISPIWNEDGTVLEMALAVALLSKIMKQKQDSNNVPIIIHCEDGISKTGIIMTVLNSIRELNIRKSINIFNAVNNLRRQRIGMVPTLACYTTCYSLLNEYCSIHL